MGSVETVTVLFTDLVGSTGLASRIGPGPAEELRRTHFGLLREAIRAAGGTEVKNLGDGLMVVFPSSSGAVGCAVDMQQRLDLGNRRLEEQLAIRIGISAGEADLEEGDYFGPPVVEAARLCAAAEGGQILCGELVRMMARDGHPFRSVGTLELKGLREPFPAWQVGWEPLNESSGVLSLPQRMRGVPPIGYVGRENEREMLASLLAQARDGDRRVVFVSGEPGIGKTRLATHLAVEAHGSGTTVLYGRCEEDLGVPYGPWVEVVSHYVREAPEAALRAHAAAHGGELARLVPEVRNRIADWPDPTESEPETERYLLFSAVTRLLYQAAADTPVLIVLDDLHWAEKPSLDLLRHLVTRGDGCRLMVICTYRDSDLTRSHPLTALLADLNREDGISRLPIKGLGVDDVIAIMEAAAGHELEADGRRLADAIVRETDGNPFFVGELLRHLLESQAVVRGEDGRFRLEGSIEELGLPQSVREVVGRRVERLSEGGRRALSAAAVIGRDFDVGLLAEVLGTDEDELLDLLDEALEASVLNESSGAVGRFTFAHALINHTLYDELGRTRRARLHARIAEAIEAACGDDPGERIAEIAHHSLKAATPGAPDRAIDHARRAGERALADLAPDEALRWFGQAIELADDTPGTGAEVRCDLLTGLGEAQLQVGDPAYRATLLEASRIGAELGDAERTARATLANSRGFNLIFGEVDNELIDALERAEALDGRAHPGRSARLLARQAAELQFDPDHARRWQLSDQALALAREAGDRLTLAHVLFDHLYATWGRTDAPTMRALWGEFAELAEASRDPALVAWAHHGNSTVSLIEGDLDGFETSLRRVLATVDDLGQPALRWFARYYLTSLHVARGDLAEAERVAEEALRIGTEVGQADALLVYGGQISSIRSSQDRLDEIVPVIEQGVERYPGMPAWRAGLASTYAYLDRAAEAEALLREVVATGLESLPQDQTRTSGLALYTETAFVLEARYAARALYDALEPRADENLFNGAVIYGCAGMHLGMLASLLGDERLADEHFEACCRFHDRGGFRMLGAAGRVAWGEALARRGDTERAHDLARTALAVAREHGYALTERRATQVLEPARTVS